MIDKSTNKERVARWRAEKVNQGFKALTVFLSPEALQMVKFLHGHLHTRRKTAELIERAIRTLYKDTHQKRP